MSEREAMKTAEEFAKQIDAMTMTYDLHWQNIKPLIEARDAEIRAEYGEKVEKLREALEAGELSDGYHTHKELYEYRRVYNALLFNEWAKQGLYDVHKSKWHSDGELCFGGGWFIVVAQLPAGQISNHYKLEHWDDFQIPDVVLPNDYDGHTPAIALERASAALSREPQEEKQ